jgi:hypothetical protein
MTTIRPISGAYRVPPDGSAGAFYFQRTRTHQHQGVDINAETGRPVLAVGKGRVEIAHDAPASGFAGYGRVIVLHLDSGERVLYAHLARVDVAKDDLVSVGQVIGLVGNSQFRRGNAADDGPGPRPGGARVMGSHLHFEVATAPYPMGPEAPHRLDAGRWLRSLPQLAPTRRAATISPEAKTSLLAELARRIVETERAVVDAASTLTARGMSGAAAMVISAWNAARSDLAAAGRAVDPRAAISEAATAWTHTVDQAAAYAQRTTDAVVRAAAAELRHAQDEAWRSLRAAGSAAAEGAGKLAIGGGLILLLGVLMLGATTGVSAGGGIAGARYLSSRAR